MLLRLIIVVGLATVLSATRYQRSTAVLIRQPNAFADACHPQGHGCECRIPSDIPGKVETLSFAKDCRGAIQELQTAANKKKLNKEIEARFGDFRDGCFPRPSGGCRCNEKNAHGDEVVVNYRNSDECKVQTRQSHVSSPSDTHQTDTFGEACRPSGHGCECRIKSDTDGKMQILHFSTTCKNAAQELRTAANKQKLSEEIKTKFGDFKDGCFPRPSGGCRCNEKNSLGEEVVVTHDKPEECKVPMRRRRSTAVLTHQPNAFAESCHPRGRGCECRVRANTQGRMETLTFNMDCKAAIKELQTAANKKKLSEEIKNKYGGFRDGCFPRPSGGCRCNEKNDKGEDMVKTYSNAEDCQVRVRTSRASGRSQNVRDPVRERAQANYARVLDELKNKFAGLREGCFPRPKGCLCIIGKDKDGRDITDRRRDDKDCKCKPGEVGNGCPAGGA